MYTNYDVIIIGSGCARLAAGIYTSRAGLRTLIMEKQAMGGELMNRQLIENYLARAKPCAINLGECREAIEY